MRGLGTYALYIQPNQATAAGANAADDAREVMHMRIFGNLDFNVILGGDHTDISLV
jgi:hypothetical protein